MRADQPSQTVGLDLEKARYGMTGISAEFSHGFSGHITASGRRSSALAQRFRHVQRVRPLDEIF